jgi:NADH:ubiquinone oxidoreductase subunit F (NADH-binding)
MAPEALIAALDDSRLTGRGGGAVAAALKLAYLSTSRRAHVVINAMEGEPASAKATALLEVAPHLVFDGAALLAESLGAREVTLAIASDDERCAQAAQRALSSRRDPVSVSMVRPPSRYISGEESTLANWMDTGVALPTFRATKPSFVTIKRKSALIHNVETLAHIGLIARYGPEWFREIGAPESPGTALITISGAVAKPSTVEWETGQPLASLIEHAGGVVGGFQGALLGGYGGTFVDATALSTGLDEPSLRHIGATLGSGIVVVLPLNVCPLMETSRIVNWMARESAGQCGPCVYGLPALGAEWHDFVTNRRSTSSLQRLDARLTEIDGRGACRHPDGVVRLVRSAVRAFRPHVELHRSQGPCAGIHAPSVLTFPRGGAR